jgi:hypothetical protein
LELVDLSHELLCGYCATGSERSFGDLFSFYVVSSNNAIGSEVLCGCIALTNMQLYLLPFLGKGTVFTMLAMKALEEWWYRSTHF